jgi:hypothetical protein
MGAARSFAPNSYAAFALDPNGPKTVVGCLQHDSAQRYPP